MLIQSLREMSQRVKNERIKRILTDVYRYCNLILYTRILRFFGIEKSGDAFVLTFKRGELKGKRIVFPYSNLIDEAKIATSVMDTFGYLIPPQQSPHLVLDIGSFPGDFPTIYRLSGRSGKIIALEPDPDNFRYVLLMLHVNGIQADVLNLGVYREDCLRRFSQKGLESSFSSNGRLEIRSTTIDRIVDSYPVLIKMDIEGDEIAALEGSKKTLESYSEWVIACYHIIDGEPTYKRLLKMFPDDYVCRLVNPRHLTLHAYRIQSLNVI